MKRELVQEIYHEATRWCEDNATGTPIAWEFEEKFAELIIEECIRICLEQRDPSSLNYKPSEKFADAIRQRFGMK
jgi:hypothetical protein